MMEKYKNSLICIWFSFKVLIEGVNRNSSVIFSNETFIIIEIFSQSVLFITFWTLPVFHTWQQMARKKMVRINWRRVLNGSILADKLSICLFRHLMSDDWMVPNKWIKKKRIKKKLYASSTQNALLFLFCVLIDSF